MNEQPRGQLTDLLTSRVSEIARLLQKQCSESGFYGKIHHGSWSNDAGTTVAYISCFLDNDRGKEAIETTWHMRPDQNAVVLQGDIGYTNGQIIKSILDLSIDFADVGNVLPKVQAMLDEGLTEALIQLKSILGCRETKDDQGETNTTTY